MFRSIESFMHTPERHIPIASFWSDAFELRGHLASFLSIDALAIEQSMQDATRALAVRASDFSWQQFETFYRDDVGELYLLELAAWHLSNRDDYIGNTLRLLADVGCGRVLDFGGGLGTHTLAAAMLPAVTSVTYWDINPLHRRFLQYRVDKLGLAHKVRIPESLDASAIYETIICLDVLEHLPDPAQQLQIFYTILSSSGKAILNWYFFKGFEQEYPFHLDSPDKISAFYRILQRDFLELFHPYLITTRTYGKMPEQKHP